MSNLILEKDKKNIKKEYVGRLAIVFLFGALLLFLLSLILLVPSYVLSENKAHTVQERLDFLKKYVESQKDENSLAVIQKTKEGIAALLNEDSEQVFEVIKTITNAENSNIFLSSISYRVLPDGGSQASISGISSDRDSLIQFRNRLEQEEIFQNVNLPISNLAENVDLEFSISLDIKENVKTN